MLRYFLIRTIINNAHILGKNTILGPTEAIFKEQTAGWNFIGYVLNRLRLNQLDRTQYMNG